MLFSFKKDPRKILKAKDHAWKRNKPFYANTKVSVFANFEVGRLIKKKKKKKMEKSVVLQFLYIIGMVYFTYFEF